MIKSLLVIILVALGLWVARSAMLRLQNKPANRPDKANNQNKKMLQCSQCQTYIPADDAIIQGGKSFCSTQHLEDWNKSA